MPLIVSGDTASSSLLGEGLCGGACSGQTEPHEIRYLLELDDTSGEISLGISGLLPTNEGPAPDVCWFNEATLQCNFAGVAP